MAAHHLSQCVVFGRLSCAHRYTHIYKKTRFFYNFLFFENFGTKKPKLKISKEEVLRRRTLKIVETNEQNTHVKKQDTQDVYKLHTSENIDLGKYVYKFDEVVDKFQEYIEEFNKQREASLALFEPIVVTLEGGQKKTIGALASVTIRSNVFVAINVLDESHVPKVILALRKSNTDWNPHVEGSNVVALKLPKETKEAAEKRRKTAKIALEKAKEALKRHRLKALQEITKLDLTVQWKKWETAKLDKLNSEKKDKLENLYKKMVEDI